MKNYIFHFGTTAKKTIGHMSLYAMIGGYLKGLGDFNSHFKYSHAMHLVYRYRHDYLHSYNIMKIGGVNRKETYLNVLKRFAIHFLNEDMDMVKELPRDSNRLHVYAFLFAEYMDFDKNMDETTHCANVKLHNNSEGTEMETEYKFVFKGTGDTEEEDLFDEAMDFILDYEDEEGKGIIDVGEDMKPGFNDLIRNINQRLEGRWWENGDTLEENMAVVRELIEEWRGTLTGGGDSLPGEGDSLPGGTVEEEPVAGGDPNLNPELFPFVNDFIISVIKDNNFTPKLTNIFNDVLPVTTLVGGQVLKSISSHPVKMHLLLCPNVNPSLDKIAQSIQIDSYIQEPITQEERTALKELFGRFLTDEDFILGDDEIVAEMDSLFTGDGEDFRGKFPTHLDVLKPVFRYITGSRKTTSWNNFKSNS